MALFFEPPVLSPRGVCDCVCAFVSDNCLCILKGERQRCHRWENKSVFDRSR